MDFSERNYSSAVVRSSFSWNRLVYYFAFFSSWCFSFCWFFSFWWGGLVFVFVFCFLQDLMSSVLHYALPPGFSSTSGEVGLTPTRRPPSAHYSLGLDGGPSGRWLAGWVGVTALGELMLKQNISAFWFRSRGNKVKVEKERHLLIFLLSCLSAYTSFWLWTGFFLFSHKPLILHQTIKFFGFRQNIVNTDNFTQVLL